MENSTVNAQNLLLDISNLIETSKKTVSIQINSGITILFWQIGNKITEHILHNKRAEYGKEIVVTLSRELQTKFGKNFEERNLRRMIQFAEKFNDFEKVVTLSRQLTWSHFIALIPIKKEEARYFYAN